MHLRLAQLRRFSFVWLLLLIFPVRQAYAGRPLTVDDVAPVPPGFLELELGYSHGLPNNGGRDQKWPIATATLGIFDGLEFGLAIQRVNYDDSESAPKKGFEDLHVNAKYKFLDEAAGLPALAASLDIKAPTANRSKGLSTGKADETFLLIATKSFASYALHVNFGYTIAGRTAGAKLRNQLRGGGAMEWAVTKQLSIVGEIFGSSRTETGGVNQADFQLGARYALTPTLVLDVGTGRSLHTSGNTFQGTFGLTWLINLGKLTQQ